MVICKSGKVRENMVVLGDVVMDCMIGGEKLLETLQEEIVDGIFSSNQLPESSLIAFISFLDFLPFTLL